MVSKKYIFYSIIIVLILFLCFLHSINFRLDTYLLYDLFPICDRHIDFENFDYHKENLEVFTKAVLKFSKENEKYNKFYAKEEYILAYSYDNGNQQLNIDGYQDMHHSLFAFPESDEYYGDSAGGVMVIRDNYPEYVFFTEERTNRIFVYTDGRYPKDLIENMEENDYVKVVKLADGWYDLRPFKSIFN